MNRTKQLFIWTLVCLCMLSLPAAASAEWYNPMSWMGSSSSKKSSGPSTLQKINENTKQFFYKTGDYLNPFNDGNDKKDTRYKYNGGFRGKKKQQSSSWFGGLFTTEAEPKPAETISDFLDAPRPGF